MNGPFVVSIIAVCAHVGPASASPSFQLLEPEAPPPREVTEQGTSPLYYRLSPNTVGLLSRTSIGGHTRFTGETDTSFTLDFLAGAEVRFGRDATTGLWIEGGYSYVRGHEHLAVLGVGIARRQRTLFGTAFALVPHVVAGRIDGETGIGVRTSAIAAWAAYGIELAHQVVIVDARQVHEMHLAFTLPFVAGGDE